MTENTKANSDANSTHPGSSVPLESILCTDELKRRPSRSPDYEKESRALVALAEALSESPRTVLQTLAETILHVCRAGSAGISLLTKDDGGKRFYWPAIAGEWKPYIGGGTPRDFGPCGDVLDRNTTLLMRRVQQRYTYFEPVKPPLEEALLVPFYVQGKAVGTIWAVTHDDRKLDAEDERLMKSLGKFASSAYQTLDTLDALTFQVAEAMKAEQATGWLAAIIDSSDDAIISKDLDGIITSWNKSAERLFGYTAEEAVGKHVMLIIPSDLQEQEATILERLKRGERIEHLETVRLRKDGANLDVSLTISPVRGPTGQIVGASKMARDITDRKQAERTTALLGAIIDSSDDAIISKSLDGIIVSWNKSAERMFGYAALEAIGQHIHLIIPSDRLGEEANILARLRKGERIEHFETIRVRKDGSPLDISLTISPVKDGAGRVIGASKVARDITDRKRAEKALRESEDRLRTFARGLEAQVQLRTQELEERNTEVVQQSEELRELSRRLLVTQDDERRRIARDLHDSAGQIVTALGMHLASITQHALKPEVRQAAQESHEMVRQLSKEIRTVSYLLHPPLLDETGLSEAIRWYIKGLSERSDLRIDLDIPNDFGRLPDDVEVAIFRIVQECLTNIHRHSGGKAATIRLSRNISNVSLQIQDDGTGMPKETLVAIRTQHSGVGITGIRERVRHLGGNLDIQSNSNGTKISVTLPVMTSSSANAGIAAKASAAGEHI